MLVRRQSRRRSTRIDVDALPVYLDEKRQRFTTNPVGSTSRRPGAGGFPPIERYFAEKPVVRRGEYANFPWTNLPHVSACDRIARSRPCPSHKVESSGRSDEARVRFRHDNWNIE